MTVEPVAPVVARGLSVTFGAVRAVDSVDLTVAAGAVVGLVGPNGCGKTTTLRAVLGLVPASGGSVRVHGAVAGSLRARSLAAWVPDEPLGLEELAVTEYLDLVAALWRADAAYEQRTAVLLRGFGLERARRSLLGALSHGQRRLVAIVAAVALARPLLAVDEATAALDPEAVIALREVVRAAAARGAGVLLATQDLHFAETVCDRVVLLSAGSVVAEGSVAALLARYSAASLEDAFVTAVGAAAHVRELRDALAAL